MSTKNKHYDIEDLIAVMRDLRTPETGCPWDLEQDFKSIIPHTLEEAYEVADAIDRHDMHDLREELGDLLFQSVYHAQMAAEQGHFTLHDVIHDVTTKMITRHPHVFGDAKAQSATDVNAIWDQQKSREKPVQQSAIDGVTPNLPALLKSQKLQKKAAKVGFEWRKTENILDKLEEEINELRAAIVNHDQSNIEEEIGDVFFVLSNFARKHGVNAEEALRQCNNKFERRFRGLETELNAQNIDLPDASLDQMEHAWNNQKRKEKHT